VIAGMTRLLASELAVGDCVFVLADPERRAPPERVFRLGEV
jgi:hypothetical protein